MFERMGPEYQIIMFERIGLEFQCLQTWGQNSNVYKTRARIPMFERMGPAY